MEMTANLNTLKVRDDHRPVLFEATKEAHKFKLSDGQEASWVSTPKFSHKELRSRIEPWLTSLFQSEHLSLLLGSGLMHAVHFLAANKPAVGMDIVSLSNYQREISKAAEDAAKKSGREKGNLEDQIRVANELLRGLEILGKTEEAKKLRDELRDILEQFSRYILQNEAGVARGQEKDRMQAFNTLVTFLMSFASRTGGRD